MTPRMLRTVGYAAFAVMLAIAVIWLLQAIGIADLIDDPLIGIIAFGLLGFGLTWLAKRGSQTGE